MKAGVALETNTSEHITGSMNWTGMRTCPVNTHTHTHSKIADEEQGRSTHTHTQTNTHTHTHTQTPPPAQECQAPASETNMGQSLHSRHPPQNISGVRLFIYFSTVFYSTNSLNLQIFFPRLQDTILVRNIQLGMRLDKMLLQFHRKGPNSKLHSHTHTHADTHTHTHTHTQTHIHAHTRTHLHIIP